MIIDSQKRLFGRGEKVSLFTLGTMRATESLEKMYGIIKNAHYVGTVSYTHLTLPTTD